jgi:hypothetical protein
MHVVEVVVLVNTRAFFSKGWRHLLIDGFTTRSHVGVLKPKRECANNDLCECGSPLIKFVVTSVAASPTAEVATTEFAGLASAGRSNPQLSTQASIERVVDAACRLAWPNDAARSMDRYCTFLKVRATRRVLRHR